MSATTLRNTKTNAQAVPQPINRSVEIWRAVIVSLGVTAMVGLLIALFGAISFLQRPFVGAFVNAQMIVGAAQPTSMQSWTGLEAGLTRQDRLIALNEIDLLEPGEHFTAAYPRFANVLATLSPGDTIRVDFLRDATNASTNVRYCRPLNDASIAACTLAFDLTTMPELDALSFIILPLFTALVALGIGISLLYFRSTSPEALAAAAIAFLTSMYAAGIFDMGNQGTLAMLWLSAAALQGGAMIAFGLVFPRRLIIGRRLPLIGNQRIAQLFHYLEYVPLAAGFIAAGMFVYFFINPSGNYTLTNAALYSSYISTASLLLFLLLVTFQRGTATTPLSRQQSNTLFIGATLSSVLVLFWVYNRLAIANLENAPIFPVESLIVLSIFPVISLAYAILRPRLFDTDHLISRGVTYTLLGLSLIVSIYLVVLGASLLALDLLQASSVVTVSVVLFVMVAFFTPVRNRLQARVDQLYFRRARSLQEIVESFNRKLTTLNTFSEILYGFRDVVNEALAPRSLYIYLEERSGGDFKPYIMNRGQSDLQFTTDSNVVRYLSEQTGTTSLQAGERWPAALLPDRARLRLLDTQLLMPLRGSGKLIGFVVVGQPENKRLYNYDDVQFLSDVTRNLSIAVERSRVIDSLEQRVRELDVLSQVGQAVNFTIELDDLLELIYAQTSKLVDVPCFYIALYEAEAQQLYFAFFLEEDERYPEQESRRWSLNDDLFSAIVKNGSEIRINDYREEMHRRNAKSVFVSDKLRAWMGVPLTAGRRVLGVIAAGKLNDRTAYSDEQFKIFSDISALAATSLDKASLFTQTRQRERQLTVLNDISRQLVSTERDVEKLLQIIMNAAVEILGAEAGSLLLIADDDTDDLEFRVVIGGAGDELIGTRMPAGQGIVGQVVHSGEPLIVNDAEQDPRHGKEVAKNFISQTVLAVPLIAQDDVIGVLEVINKKDGTPFLQSESDMLTTFASQAAVAIQNARLFERTDQQLEQRLSELETLERIDTEVNRTLDLKEISDITVKRAMHALNANAGLLGIVHEGAGKLEVVTIIGYNPDEYPEGAEGEENLDWPLDAGVIGRVMRIKSADITMDVRNDPDYKTGLKNSNSQLTLPMKSGDEIIAVLVLEKNTQPRFTLVDWQFAQRIAEHASIAIANAQFYNALMQANKTKSHFMGIAAHELKNPLTSIIGYADTLTGPMGSMLNDEQRQNFLQVIHANAKRMEIIISDLRDTARQEAGEFSIDPEPMNVYHVVVETLRPFVKALQDKDQDLVNNVPENLPLVMGDSDRLIQVLTNLVSNANKYSPEGTTITVEGQYIENFINKDGLRRGRVVRLSVIDEGIGMSEADQKKLFREQYFRSSNEEAKKQPGTGLGMVLSMGIMKNHGGDIWVESELGVGSAFHITVPVATEAQLAGETNERAAEPASD